MTQHWPSPSRSLLVVRKRQGESLNKGVQPAGKGSTHTLHPCSTKEKNLQDSILFPLKLKILAIHPWSSGL